jgi:hypothetical protein
MTQHNYRNGVIYRQHRQCQTWAGQITLICTACTAAVKFLGFPSPLGSSSDSSSSDDGAASDEDEDGGSDDEGSD